jgi:hypothetical protein
MNLQKNPRIRKGLFLMILVIYVAGSASGMSWWKFPKPQTKQEADWNEIIELQKEGQAIIDGGETIRAQRVRRREIFSTAAEKLKTYIGNYDQDTGSLAYLRAIYRLALFLEYARRGGFKAIYLECLRHPRIDDADAVYDGKPIARLVRDRVGELPNNGTTEGPRTLDGRSFDPPGHIRP